MAEEEKDDNQASGRNDAASKQGESGDPGRTPGAAEGDRETVEEDLREKEGEADKRA